MEYDFTFQIFQHPTKQEVQIIMGDGTSSTVTVLAIPSWMVYDHGYSWHPWTEMYGSYHKWSWLQRI